MNYARALNRMSDSSAIMEDYPSTNMLFLFRRPPMISRVVWLSALLLPLCWDAAFCETPKLPVLSIRSAPQRPVIEVRGSNEFLNFEMLVRNASGLTLRISQIELNVYDSAHDLVLRKSINTDAFAPSSFSYFSVPSANAKLFHQQVDNGGAQA
jgi:hypothetical protein